MMQIEKPIFVLGVPHSGTSWLGKAITQDPEIVHIPETNYIWMWGNFKKADDTLGEEALTPKIKKHIEQQFVEHLKKHNGKRICDKTPRNCLRIPFIRTVFPDAKIILITRDGRSVMSSMSKSTTPSKQVILGTIRSRLKRVPIRDWRFYFSRASQIVKKRAMGQPLDSWGIRPPGWKEWAGKYSPHMVAAKQWVETIKIATHEGRKLPPENYLEVYYENLVNSPQEEMGRIANFVDIKNPHPILEYAVKTTDPSRIDKWKDLDIDVLNEVRKVIEPTMAELGYRW
jgi:hypothetical protein